jgi:hypothetical protein
MKKNIWIVIIIVILAGLSYYFMQKKPVVNTKLENKITTASEDYFNKYISTNDSASTYTITLKMLKKANSNGENYDLKGLEKCDENKTLARVTVNYKNGKPKKTQVELKC